VRAIVLQTAGKNFCAGADLSQRTPGGASLYDQAFRLFSIRTPIVAAVQGQAVGAGLGLTTIADFRIASPDAKFAATFVKLGFHPGFGLTYTLPRMIGQQKASLMFLTGRRIEAADALAWGLADQVAEDHRGAALELAREIAGNAPIALNDTRASLRAGLAEAVRRQTNHELALQDAHRKTSDYAEGVKATAERRPPVFTGQ
jgi:enoyl-CoA hydratase/carnithine racemase